ncbi:MAG TPA: hypothetical protein DEX36_10630, partial [Glutamicibacter sp.]
MSLTANAAPRSTAGTDVEIMVMVIGWPRPRKNPPISSAAPEAHKLSMNTGASAMAIVLSQNIA